MSAIVRTDEIVNSYQNSLREVCEHLLDTNLSSDERFRAVASSIQTGGSVVEKIAQVTRDTVQEAENARRDISELRSKYKREKRKARKLRREVIKLQNDNLRSTCESLSAENLERIKDSLQQKNILLIGAGIGSVVTIPVVVPTFFLINSAVQIQGEIKELEDHKWVYENFPEASKCDYIFKKAMDIRESYHNCMNRHFTNVMRAYDELDSGITSTSVDLETYDSVVSYAQSCMDRKTTRLRNYVENIFYKS